VFEAAARFADAFHETMREYLMRFHVKELIFDRRTTGIDHQDFHHLVGSHVGLLVGYLLLSK
jgi:hypothetical protein